MYMFIKYNKDILNICVCDCARAIHFYARTTCTCRNILLNSANRNNNNNNNNNNNIKKASIAMHVPLEPAEEGRKEVHRLCVCVCVCVCV